MLGSKYCYLLCVGLALVACSEHDRESPSDAEKPIESAPEGVAFLHDLNRLYLGDANPTSRDQIAFERNLINRLARENPRKYLHFLREKRPDLINFFIQRVATFDPLLAREWLSLVDRKNARRAVVHEVVTELVRRKDFKNASGFALELSGVSFDSAIETLMPAMVEHDMEGALAYFDELPFGSTRTNACETVARGIVTSSGIASALEWVKDLSDTERSKANDGICQALETVEKIHEALELTSNNSLRKEFGSRLLELEVLTSSGSLEDQLQHAKELSHLVGIDRDEAESYERRIVLGWAEYQVPDEIRAYAENLEPGHLQSELVSKIILDAAKEGSYVDTASWAENQLNGDVAAKAIESIAVYWLQQNSVEASEWISTITDERLRDVGLRNMVNHLVNEGEFESSALWAAEIVDEKLRELLLKNSLSKIEESRENGL